MLQSAIDYSSGVLKVCGLRSFLWRFIPLLFSSLHVSYKSTAGHSSAWAKLWDRLLEKPEEPRYFIDTAEMIENSMRPYQAELHSAFIEAIKRVQGGQNGK